MPRARRASARRGTAAAVVDSTRSTARQLRASHIQVRRVRNAVAERYIDLYERVTGTEFSGDLGDKPVAERIRDNISSYF